MKQCIIISNYIINEYRKELVLDKIKLFKSYGLDIILVSGEHIQKLHDVENYITVKNLSLANYKTSGIYSHFIIGNLKFVKIEGKSINHNNFYIKMYQIVVNYAKNLGYDFCYFIDQDTILKESFCNFIFDENINKSLVYFFEYTIPEVKSAVELTFFCGNTSKLSNLFSENNLSWLENFAKQNTVYVLENSVYFLIDKFKNDCIKILNYKNEEIFLKHNLISSANNADVFYNYKHNKYVFLHSNGNPCSNHFGAELYLNDTLIYSNTFDKIGHFYFKYLENDENYKIKSYENFILEKSLVDIKNIFTNSKEITTQNYIIEM